MKKIILNLVFLVGFLLFFLNSSSFVRAVESCQSFSAVVNGSFVSFQGNCQTEGKHILQIKNSAGETIIANEVYVTDSELSSPSFHLEETGTYQAILLFFTDIVGRTNFTISQTSALKCGDPCNANDENCPSECPSAFISGRWTCYKIPPQPTIAQPTIAQPTPTIAQPTIVQNSAIDFSQIAIPGLKPIFQSGGPENVGAIITLILPYLFVIAGLMLLFLLIYGGFHMMIAANDEKGLVEAKGKITNALVGFLLLFVSYWIVQIMEYILGIKIF